LAHLAKNPGLLYSIDPRKFEQLVATLLEKQGCMVSLTPRSADGGFDIMACLKSSLANLLFLVECKRYAPDNKVGVEIVRRIYGVTEMHRANCGLIITTSSFTRGALTESERVAPRVALKDYISLCEWLKSAVGDNA
jgi:restriction system protein